MLSKQVFVFLLLLQFAAFLALLFDLPVLRQIFGFCYLLFLPGYLILVIMQVNELSSLEQALFSVGLSLAFLMLIGLLSNQIYPLLDIKTPLSAYFLFPSIFCITLGLFILAIIIKRKELLSTKLQVQKLQSTNREATPKNSNLRYSIFFLIPLLAFVGAIVEREFNNNFLLLITIVTIALIFICACFKGTFHKNSYPLLIVTIASFLIFHVSFSSDYIIGYDAHLEYYFASLTSTNSFWNYSIPHEYNAMLSITILPTIFLKFLNIEMTWIFKLVYTSILTLIPVTLYMSYKQFVTSRIAVLSAFLFISIDLFFFGMLGLNRQIIGELFFALLILLIVEKRIKPLKKNLLFVTFSAGLIVSHYSLSYIFLFYILLAYILNFFWSRSNKKKTGAINGRLVLVYLSLITFWYVAVFRSPFDALVFTLQRIYTSIQWGISMPGIGGLAPAYISPLHKASQYLFYCFQLAILIGMIYTFYKRKIKNFKTEFFSLALVSLAILTLCMAVPSFADGLMASRFYHIALFFLAPFFVLGIIASLRLAVKALVKSHALRQSSEKYPLKALNIGLFIAAVFIALLLLFQVGFVYEVANDFPSSIALNINRLNANPTSIWQAQTPMFDVLSAQWISQHVDNRSQVFSDRISSFMVLTSYGMRPTMHFSQNSREGTYDFLLSNGTRPPEGAYVYLRTFNVKYGQINGPAISQNWNTSALSCLNNFGTIYTNGDSMIYYNP